MVGRVKQYGEVMTPPELVEEMLDKLPKEVWLDPEKRLLEPCCGNGNFVVAMARRKRKAGLNPKTILETLYAVDLLPDNVAVTRFRVLDELGVLDDEECHEIVERHIRQGNALEDDFGNDEFWKEPQELSFTRFSDIGDHNIDYFVRYGIHQQPIKAKKNSE